MTYTKTRCWKCDLDLVVEAHDFAERNYCETCAWDKLAHGRNPTRGDIDD